MLAKSAAEGALGPGTPYVGWTIDLECFRRGKSMCDDIGAVEGCPPAGHGKGRSLGHGGRGGSSVVVSCTELPMLYKSEECTFAGMSAISSDWSMGINSGAIIEIPGGRGSGKSAGHGACIVSETGKGAGARGCDGR